MLDRIFEMLLLPGVSIEFTVLILLIFFVAGIVKGFLGIGLPAAAMAFLTLIIAPKTAISLMLLPIIFTNLMQYIRAPEPRQTAMEYRYFALAIMISIFVTSLFINNYPDGLLTASIGAAMVAFSINLLFGIILPVSGHIGWQVGVGLFSGILGGLSSIWSPPVAMYLLARNVSKDKFISATGFLFLAGCFPLAAGLMISGVVTTETLVHSLLGLVAVLAGFRVGENLRGFVSQVLFRKLVLIAFLIMGLRLIATGIL